MARLILVGDLARQTENWSCELVYAMNRVLWISLSTFVLNFASITAWQANNCARAVGMGTPYGDKLQECQSYLEAAWGFRYFSQSSPTLEMEVLVTIVALNVFSHSILRRRLGNTHLALGKRLIVLTAAAGIILPLFVFD